MGVSLVLEVTDLAAYRARLAKLGFAEAEPVRAPFDCLVSCLRDPDGNIVWLHEKLAK